jgi:hypothetical protein
MWKTIFLMLFFPFFAEAKTIPWKDVVSSIVWLKVAPDFSVQLTSVGKDEVSFSVFGDLYRVTRSKSHYLIQRGTELTLLPFETVEKALYFVKAKKRGDAILPEDAFQQSIHPIEPPQGYALSKHLYQCRSDLPLRIRIDGVPVDQILKHTWLQHGSAESFGMPFTDQETYLGGLAHVRTPDSFIARKPKHLDCAPVWIPESVQDEAKFSKRAACIARVMTLPQDPVFEGSVIDQSWVANLDYHVLDRNCLKAVRFLLACAGAVDSQEVNRGIGGAFDWNESASITLVKADYRDRIREVRSWLDDLRKQSNLHDLGAKAEVLLNAALDVDAAIRGAKKGSATPKTLREICTLAQNTCDQEPNRSINF